MDPVAVREDEVDIGVGLTASDGQQIKGVIAADTERAGPIVPKAVAPGQVQGNDVRDEEIRLAGHERAASEIHLDRVRLALGMHVGEAFTDLGGIAGSRRSGERPCDEAWATPRTGRGESRRAMMGAVGACRCFSSKPLTTACEPSPANVSCTGRGMAVPSPPGPWWPWGARDPHGHRAGRWQPGSPAGACVREWAVMSSRAPFAGAGPAWTTPDTVCVLRSRSHGRPSR
jgi:hypothetical protein